MSMTNPDSSLSANLQPPEPLPLQFTDSQVQAALQSDAELLDLYVLGKQQQALLIIMDRFTPMVTGVIRRVVSHSQDAEDAFQATFLILIQSANKIRTRRSVAAWLYGVAYRTACRVRQKSRRQVSGVDDMELQDHRTSDPIQNLVRQIEISNLDRELQTLPESLREPLVEHYILGLTAKEIAQRMELSSSAVEGRLRRGRQLLRSRLAERGASLSVCAAGVTWIREHNATALDGQQLTENFVNSLNFQSPESLPLNDPYLHTLVEGETAMKTLPALKSAGFLGTVGFVTVSLSMVALAMQGLGQDAKTTGKDATAQKANQTLQAVPANDAAGASTSVPMLSTTPAVKGQPAKPNAVTASTPTNQPTPTRKPSTEGVIQFKRPAPAPRPEGADALNTPADGPAWLAAGNADREAMEHVRDLLNHRVAVDFNGVPLRQVLEELSDQIMTPIVWGEDDLTAEVDPESPVTLSIRQELPAKEILKLLLSKHELEYEIHPEFIKIVGYAEDSIRYYDLSYVLPNSAAVPSVVQSIKNVSTTMPDIAAVGSLLVVRSSEPTHELIEQILAEVAKMPREGLPQTIEQAEASERINASASGISAANGGMF